MIIILIVSVSTFIFALMIGLIALLMMISQENGFGMSNEQCYINNITKWPRYINFSSRTSTIPFSFSNQKSVFLDTPQLPAFHVYTLLEESLENPVLVPSWIPLVSPYMAFSSSSFEVATAQVWENTREPRKKLLGGCSSLSLCAYMSMAVIQYFSETKQM